MRGTDPLDFAVVRTHLRHADGVYDVIRLANGYPLDRYCHCINPEAVAEQLERFPEGQFVAVTYEDGKEKVVGMATTMLTSHTPEDESLAWYDQIGSFGLRNHDDDGDWLYGVEIAVHPDYQRHGIGSALYRSRLALIGELGLDGWFAGGMLMGYHRYRDVMSPREYGQRVIAGEVDDPTVSMQLKRGFEPLRHHRELLPGVEGGSRGGASRTPAAAREDVRAAPARLPLRARPRRVGLRPAGPARRPRQEPRSAPQLG